MELNNYGYEVTGLIGFDYLGFDKTLSNHIWPFAVIQIAYENFFGYEVIQLSCSTMGFSRLKYEVWDIRLQGSIVLDNGFPLRS